MKIIINIDGRKKVRYYDYKYDDAAHRVTAQQRAIFLVRINTKFCVKIRENSEKKVLFSPSPPPSTVSRFLTRTGTEPNETWIRSTCDPLCRVHETRAVSSFTFWLLSRRVASAGRAHIIRFVAVPFSPIGTRACNVIMYRNRGYVLLDAVADVPRFL